MNKKQESVIDPKDVEDTLSPSNVPSDEERTEHDLAVLPESYFSKNANVGLEDITSEDIPTPTLSLIQSTSKVRDEEGRPYIPGTFYYKTTRSTYKELDISILVVTKQLFPSYINKDEMEKVYVFLGAIMPSYMPFKIYLRGYGAGAARQFMGEVKALKRPMYALQVTLSAVGKENDKGTFYVPQFSIKGLRTSHERIINLEELAHTYSQNREKIQQESAEELN